MSNYSKIINRNNVNYEVYENIKKFIIKYRNFELIEPDSSENFLKKDEFLKEMMSQQYVITICTNPKDGKKVFIVLIEKESKYVKKTENFRKLLEKIESELEDDDSDVYLYLITENPLSSYAKKALKKYPNFIIKNYLHENFNIEISDGPWVDPQRILSKEEEKELCSKHMKINPLSLPGIRINDPVCIWLGAEIGDIIESTRRSEITLNSTVYRIVSPETGKTFTNLTS